MIESHSVRKRIFNYYMKSGALIDKRENFQKIIYSHQEAIRNKSGEASSEDASTKYNKDQIIFFFNAIQAEVGNLDNFKIEAQFILQKLGFSKK